MVVRGVGVEGLVKGEGIKKLQIGSYKIGMGK